MMPFVRAYDAVVAGHKKYLNGLSSISLIVVSYLMIVILVENVIGMPRSMKICSFTLLVLLLGFPLFVAVRAHNEEKERLLSLDFPVTERSTLLDTPKPNTSNGLATINNIRQVGESLRYSTVQLNSLVSLWSIWSFLGRFGAGHIVMASGFLGSLYIGSLLVGLAYGSQWALMPTITSEIFRILHMGTIFYTIGIASPDFICDNGGHVSAWISYFFCVVPPHKEVLCNACGQEDLERKDVWLREQPLLFKNLNRSRVHETEITRGCSRGRHVRVGSKKMGFQEITPLMGAAMYGSIGVLTYIISTGRSDVNRVSSNEKVTAHHCAVSACSVSIVEVIKILLDASTL
ncbi:hypothetical protein Bca4012_029478 [Brassica carinata]